MLQGQKETILALLKSDKANRNYENNYWFLYEDFLDPTDGFTSFSCEDLEGKQGYITLIENLLHADDTARIFVEVYGYEEINNEQFIYSDTLIIYSKLSLTKIKQIFHEPKDIFPSDIGEMTDFPQPAFLINHDGSLVPVAENSREGYFVYYCWWD